MQGIMCYFDMLWSMCCFLFVLITVALSALNFSSYHLLPLQYLRLLIGVLSGREAVRCLYCCCYCGSMQLSAIGAFCHVFLCYLFYAHTCFSASLALIWFALSCLLFLLWGWVAVSVILVFVFELCLLLWYLYLSLAFSLSSVVYWMASPVFNSRSVDHVGMFSGHGELESALAALGYYALPFDQAWCCVYYLCCLYCDIFVLMFVPHRSLTQMLWTSWLLPVIGWHVIMWIASVQRAASGSVRLVRAGPGPVFVCVLWLFFFVHIFFVCVVFWGLDEQGYLWSI